MRSCGGRSDVCSSDLPDILLVSGHAKGAVTAGRQIQELKIDVPMIAITHCESAKLTQQFPEAADGILCPTQWAETLSYQGKYFGRSDERRDGKECGSTCGSRWSPSN